MRTGIVLPTFRATPDAAFAAATEAVGAGVDGVFCYDHIWPLGQPERPALAPFPILGALATMLGPPRGPGKGPYLGTLVARVGLVPNAVLAAQFVALEGLAPGRVIAGLGTGDKLSEAENRAYGIPFPPAAARRAEMVELGRQLARAGLSVWVAGGVAGRTEEARAAGAALTVWDAAPALVAERTAEPDAVEVTWAGPPPSASAPVGERVRVRWTRRAPRGPSSAGRSTSRSWPQRGAVPAERWVQPRATRVVDFRDGVPPHQRVAAVRLCHHKRPQGSLAAERTRRHRPRVRESGPALARRGGEQAGRGRSEPAQPPVLRLARHPEAAQRHHGPLPAQVRRDARPRDPGGHHHRGQGGLLAPDVGPGGPRRHGAGAVAVVPDPHMGAPVRRGRRAPGPAAGTRRGLRRRARPRARRSSTA